MLTLDRMELKKKTAILAKLCFRDSPWICIETKGTRCFLWSSSDAVELSTALTGEYTGDDPDQSSMILVEGKPLAKWMRSCKSTVVTLDVGAGKLELISAGLAHVMFSCGPTPGKSPSATLAALDVDGEPFIMSPDWVADVAWVTKAMSTDTTRDHLGAMLLDTEDHVMVATDGHRMHVAPCPELDHPALIPSLAANLIPALAAKSGVQIVIDGAHVSVVGRSCVALRCRNMHSSVQFPPWKQVVPKLDDMLVKLELSDQAAKQWTGNLKPLKSSAKFRVNGVVEASVCETQTTVLLPTSDKLWRDQSDPDSHDITIGLNSVYMVDAIGNVGCSILIPKDSLCPCRVETQDERVAVVMPLRL